jgi:dipeptidyl-peptidase 4
LLTSVTFRLSEISILLLLLAVGLVAPFAHARIQQDDPLMTVAESSDFTATATGEQVLSFLRELKHEWNAAELHSIGTTVEGRPIQGVVIEPEVVSKDQRPLTVLILGGIHPGECDGKEALLAYMRDLARSKDSAWFQKLRLIFVPNFNADGDARRGNNHRPGQAGPVEGMGIRENALGLDLNRDFIKLETPECRSLVAAYNQFDVDVLMDLHTTNGSLHRYQLTYDIPHNAAAPQALDQYLRRELLPSVTEKLTTKGFETFYYGNFDKPHRRWESYGHEPRYSTEYMGLRGKIGILVESYSYASFETRFLANYAFVDEVLKRLAADHERLVEAIYRHRQFNLAGTEVPIASSLIQTEESVKVLGYQTESGQPPVGPFDEKSASKHKPHDYIIPLWNQTKAVRSALLPAAYAIPSQYAWAVSRLQRHGIPVFQLPQDAQQTAQVAKIVILKSPAQPFQGHSMQSLGVEWRTEPTKLTAGTYIISVPGPLARLAAYMCEPESDESLATWNFFDPYLQEGADFPIVKLAEMPATANPVPTVTPGEIITLENTMRPGSTINNSGATALNEAPSWLPSGDTIEFVQQQQGQLLAIEAATGSGRRLTQIKQLESKLAELNAFTPAEAKAAATANNFWRKGAKQALIRHKEDLYFYDETSKIVRQITHTPELSEELAELSPTGSAVVFVRDNNLWLVNCDTTEQRQLTRDGSPQLLNGILDWVYQEELYGRGNFKAFWWSPDGQQIAYLQLDQTQVPEYMVADNVSVAQSLERTRYPKAGQPLPIVRVFVLNVRTGLSKEVNLAKFAAEDRLIGRVSWSPTNELWLQVFNRVQNRQDLVRVDTASGNVQTVLKEESKGWLEIRETPTFLSSGDFLWLSDLPSGHTHLYRVDVKTGERQTLTSGPWDVSDLKSLSKDERYAFVSGNINNPIDSQLISVDLLTGVSKQITTAPGTHVVSVDPTGSFFIDSFSNTLTPPITTLHSVDGNLVRVLSTKPSDRHEFLKIQPPKLLTIPARDGLALQTMVMLPYGVNFGGEQSAASTGAAVPAGSQSISAQPTAAQPTAAQPAEKLPVLFFVYGGPQNPTITNNWQQGNYWWHQSLCAKGYAVVLCDNRSARGRGVADTWTIRGDMGRVELQDLEDAVGWVSQQPWADSQRIGVWGWSYGGYFTAYAMTHSKLFKAGISGAPVTDWRNYDAIYTERYMDLPQANEKGYKSSSVVEAAANLHGRMLLIHGERDDNVHLSNTIQLVDALQNANKQFDLMVYPKARHGVVDPKKRYQMYQMMTDFLDRNLKS